MATRRATDLEHLPPPRGAVIAHRGVVGNQKVAVPVGWWRNHLHRDQWPNFLLGSVVERIVTRQQVYDEAGGVDEVGGGLKLLWASVAWGTGSRLRLCSRRIGAAHGTLAVTGSADEVSALDTRLGQVARLARNRATRVEAYQTLHQGRGQLIKHLGPAFGSKFLYFAGGGIATHPCQILDSRVASTLHQRGWSSLGTTGGWPALTYERYNVLLERWTEELGLESPDQWEKWLFDQRR